MNFDVVIIGGGLAGLTCAIKLQEQGKKCVIINNGQAAMDFSSGSMDLLGHLTSGQIVHNFSQAFDILQQELPQHPYSLIGKQKTLEKAKQFEQLAHSLHLGLEGTAEQNHWRVTPLGGLRTTWLSPNSVPTVWDNSPFPHKKIVVLGIEGYHDFQPQMLAENLKQNAQFSHCELTTAYLNIPELDSLRDNSREFRSVNIAQLLEHKLAFNDLVKEIKQASQGAEAIFLPACFGLDDQRFFNSLKEAVGLALFELPTLPPSLLGIRQRKQLRQRFENLGGLMLNGDRALKAEFNAGKVSKIYTQLHQQNAIYADHFVLASGSYFSNGLIAEFEQIIEPVFHSDIIGCKEFDRTNRLSWTSARFADPQPYQAAGVAINAYCQVQKQGETIENLYAIGNILGGFNSLELGCGSGVAVVTALTVADHILGGENE
ncbi:anaerobic glycerol-3-phosphate dehydrogenase subunit B [Vespertiliibacter pulmonis]|uniref:Anaerobic glycerol-3-phosphate dehydrogenase subunit B n=1 Tax=Vespertiliibacter pulmonis TaxID=1443036 RepID=A0A3N4WBQ4_9PAST|nr:glycerol-3-phosphate dehydrogenase subunit GlpB [Vespertiliibacter pulmonis]QLB20820.1 anaerobic glycerol-3-phosphate dehydrogenase subunit B [Vespertiliibacter pulmonis]RPE83470.1 glycerol 3-phosphate dehydrogenase (quinone) subunit B [Vespertiliibacter pulmonis]